MILLTFFVIDLVNGEFIDDAKRWERVWIRVQAPESDNLRSEPWVCHFLIGSWAGFLTPLALISYSLK